MRSKANKPDSFLKTRILCTALYVLCLALTLTGCGYTAATTLPEGIKTVHIDIFKNSIDITKEVSAKDKYEVYRPDLEVDVRDAIIERIFLDGNLKVSAKDRADAVLEGEILEYRKDPLRYQNEDVREYRVSLVCDIRLRRSGGAEIVVEQKGITGDATYFTSGSLQKSETQALDDAASDLARIIVNKIVENW